MRASAVVYAYHDVGVRCLQVLIDAGLEIPLVVTHTDDPREQIWFASVAELAARHGLPAIAPADPNTPELVARLRAAAPDFLFSFYYRHMLAPPLLAIPRRGAYNMHGSLLPRYRGRVPVNWAVLHGESQTGATLHEMVEKPDAGRIVDQQAVPIGPDELAVDVFRKVSGAAQTVLRRSLPLLVAGRASLRAQDLAQGSYYGGRKPEDGRIDWQRSAREIHNLVRAVAPPYPGAFTDLAGTRLFVHRTRLVSAAPGAAGAPVLRARPGAAHVEAACADGATLELLELALDGQTLTAAQFALRFGAGPIPLLPPRN